MGIMKLLILSANPFTRNGVSNVVFNYLVFMDMKDLEIDVVSICKPDPSYEKIMKDKGVNCFVIPRTFKTIIKRWYDIYKLIKDRNYDAIHLHANSHTCVSELSAAWAAGCKVRIVHSHSTRCLSPLIHKLLTPLFKSLCTHRIACGKEAGLWMFGKKPFLVMRNGVNTELYCYKPELREQYREKLGFANDNIVIGHVGGFYNVKNHKFLVEVFSQLHKQNSLYRLLLVGDGELRLDIESQIKNLGLDKEVKLTGRVQDVHNYLNAMDIIVMPSLFEGLPLALIEQQANGLHCIVSDTVSYETNVTGNIHFVTLNSSAKDWASIIDDAVSADYRTISRGSMSQDSIKKITDNGYSIREEANKMKEFYIQSIVGDCRY